MQRGFILGLVLFLSGCRGGLVGDKFIRDGLSYRVVEPAGWRRLGFEDNDLAWLSPQGHVIAVKIGRAHV